MAVKTFLSCYIFTAIAVLLAIPDYERSNDIMSLNFAILFAKNFMYVCKKNDIFRYS